MPSGKNKMHDARFLRGLRNQLYTRPLIEQIQIRVILRSIEQSLLKADLGEDAADDPLAAEFRDIAAFFSKSKYTSAGTGLSSSLSRTPGFLLGVPPPPPYIGISPASRGGIFGGAATEDEAGCCTKTSSVGHR